MKTRIFTIVLALVTLIASTASAYATGSGDVLTIDSVYSTDQFTYENLTRVTGLIDIPMCTLSISSPTADTLRVYICVHGTGTMSKIGLSSIKLQYKSGSNWIDNYDLGTKYSYNTDVCVYSNTLRNATTDVTYRINCTMYAKNASGSVQQVTASTPGVKCK